MGGTIQKQVTTLVPPLVDLISMICTNPPFDGPWDHRITIENHDPKRNPHLQLAQGQEFSIKVFHHKGWLLKALLVGPRKALRLGAGWWGMQAEESQITYQECLAPKKQGISSFDP